MALPFLEKHKPRPQRAYRSLEIVQEVEDYLSFISEKLAPYAQIVGRIKIDLPKPPPRPDCLDWLDKVERWGFPNPGSWMDQPMEWLEDVEAARLGRDSHQNKQLQEMTQKDVFEDAPSPEPIAVA